MSKRVKVLMAVLAAILLLTVGGTAVVMAEEDPETTQQPGGRGLLTRVAEILKISQEDLANAFTQAREEMRQGCLNGYAEREGIRQEQANRFRERWENRQQLCQETRQGVCPQFLDKAVGKERITPEEADEIKAWETTPEALNSLSPPARIMAAVRGRQMIAVPKGWQGARPRMAD